jgi:lactoylglutathione lyase
MTNQRDAMLAFWRDEIGFAYEGPLSVGGGVQQHRHDYRGSILKINHARDPLPDNGATGYGRIIVARPDINSPKDLEDPDGNRVRLTPPGVEGVSQIGIEVGVRELDAHKRFWGETIGLPSAYGGAPAAFQCGDSVISLREDSNAVANVEMQGRGFRYTTLQVWDADTAHAHVVSHGGVEGRPPFTHGAVARYSFVRDPDGNWIELSQRASLTGPVD